MKKQSSPDPKPDLTEIALTDEQIAIVEEFGPLDAEVSLFRPKQNRHKKLSEQIQSWYEDEDAEQTFTVPGSSFTVLVGERKLERTVSMPKLYKALKLKLNDFLERCKMNLSVIDALLPEEQQVGIVSEERTGNRTVKVIQSR